MNKKLLLITILMTTVVVLLAVWIIGGIVGNKEIETIDFNMIKDYADELVNYKLYEQAIDQYEDYLSNPDLPDKKRAHLNYLIGNIYMDNLGDYERAIGRYLKAKLIEPETDLISDIDKKIIECMERLGRSRDAIRLMSQTAGLEGEDGENAQSGDGEDIVVARLGNRKITMGELRGEIDKLPSEFRNQLEDPTRMLDFLGKYVTSELLYEAAKRRGFDKDSDVLDMADRAKKQFMVERLYQDEILNKIDISEEDVKLYYRANKDKFTVPERADVSHILLANEEDAKAALKRIKDGEDFADVCAQVSVDDRTKNSGGHIGMVAGDGFVAGMGTDRNFAQEVMKLDAGEISEPINTNVGWHIVKVNEKMPEELQDYDEVKNQVYMQMRREKEQKKFDELTNTLGESQQVEIFDDAFKEAATDKEKPADEVKTEDK